MLNDTCADCTALPAVVAVAGPQGLAGSISYQQGSLTLASGVATISANLTSSSRIYIQKTSLQSGLSTNFSLPSNLVVTKNVSAGTFTVTSYTSVSFPAVGSIAVTTGIMTVTLPTGITAVTGPTVNVLITGTYNQSGQENISTWYTITSVLAAANTFTVSTSRTSSQQIYNLNVFFPAFTNTWDNSTYDYVVIG
jgi:hypothetical protein